MPAPWLSWIVASLADMMVDRSAQSEDSNPSLMTMSLAHLWIFTLQDSMTSSVISFLTLKFASKNPGASDDNLHVVQYSPVVPLGSENLGCARVRVGRLVHGVPRRGPDGLVELQHHHCNKANTKREKTDDITLWRTWRVRLTSLADFSPCKNSHIFCLQSYVDFLV